MVPFHMAKYALPVEAAAVNIATSSASVVAFVGITIIFRCYYSYLVLLPQDERFPFLPNLIAGFYDCTRSMSYYAITIIIIIIICIVLVRFYFFIGTHNGVINVILADIVD